MELQWAPEHTERLRTVRVGWDGTEVGAPCFPPDWETEPIDLDLLRIATRFGVCAAGEYRYRRPPADHEYSFFVEDLPESSTFGFSSQHGTLLAQMSWELSDPYFDDEVPGCDPKRPYGDFTFYQLEMALHLGLIPPKKPEGEDPMTPELVTAMTDLHQRMQPALQVFLHHFVIPDGQRFVGNEWGGWERA
ncbi:hypothetical protein A5731_16960 [Mycolicibacterium conceptionense]|uniref:Uncharacterized protein n=1 Tax=Mycolicibacterium conceptionense TaxID=451644 RepID=A0A0U1DJ51_9MYCO|nr:MULTISPECIES: hypothetical protein [Mycolicibacterium]MCW1824959.1 hypothetical protein [Mycolicibacterium senegalense]OBB13673.1 hypothetical protein A5718_02835 [Mycolicibacterium conceptionense]OBF01940.1 hypothetical protein A5731_16960 [Mycolicibacterium conceptionense]OBF29256.1 hypothetical protein A5726_02050 [Mycolicibacterium conceptionense]OBF42697.1 hypothetical protein A5720_14375 [Mycolicibacterium conceptionense]